jgi:hypothetical protein
MCDKIGCEAKATFKVDGLNLCDKCLILFLKLKTMPDSPGPKEFKND